MDFNATTPIYLQIVDAVKRKILSRQWEPGDKVPPVRDLALEMGVNPNTMQKAMASLESEGLLVTERTSGRYVTRDSDCIDRARSAMTAAEMAQFRAAMQGIGYTDEELVALLTRYCREG